MEFTKDMQMLNEILGIDNTMKVISSLGGISLYIPKPDHNVIRYFHERIGDPKRTAQLLGVSERTVYRAIVSKEMEERQLDAFEDNTAKILKYGK